MKSIISKHETSMEEVCSKVEDVIRVGKQTACIVIGLTKIQVFKFGRLTYIITSINDSIVSFELENVYCFKF